ncbi:hypothetical protein Bca101_027803 [Brassica carinata]
MSRWLKRCGDYFRRRPLRILTAGVTTGDELSKSTTPKVLQTAEVSSPRKLQPSSQPSHFSHRPRFKLATICCPPPPSPPSAVLATVVTLSPPSSTAQCHQVNQTITLKKSKHRESRASLINTKREERTDLSGGEVCAGIEGSGSDAERLDDGNERLGGGGGGGGDELTRREAISETWSSSP